ncbi:MAG: CARDB domain-containing protein [Halobacteriota archaeon]
MDWSNDRRAVAPVIGSVVLFGFLIIALTSYQAGVVPSQNAETEFDHNVNVQNDMIEVRNAIMDALITGEDTYATVDLGTRYRQRVLAVNPPPASGSIQTTDPAELYVLVEGDDQTERVCGVDNTTRFIEYEPSYNEFEGAGTIRYENSILVHDYGDEHVQLSNQQLLREDTVSIIPLATSFSESGVDTVSIEPKPGLSKRTELTSPTIVLPTAMSEAEWNEILADELDTENGERATVTDGNLTLELQGSYSVRCEVLGLDEVPESGARGESASEINPADEGAVQLFTQELDGDVTNLYFRNRGETVNVEEARINFAYIHQPGQELPQYADISAQNEESSARVFTGGDFSTLEPPIEIEGGEGEDVTSVVELEWDDTSALAWFVLTFIFDTGDQGTYFVGFGQDSPFFNVDISSDRSDSEVFVDEVANVVVTIFNTGDEGTQDVEFYVNGTLEETRSVTLGVGEGDQIEFDYQTDETDSGETLDVVVASELDEDDHTIDVISTPEEPYFTANVLETNAPVEEGAELTVDAEIENIGNDTGEQTVSLTVDGEVRDTTTVELDSGASTTVTLTWSTESGDAGEYDAIVSTDDDSDSETITVFEEGTEYYNILSAEVVPGTEGGNAVDVEVEVDTNDAAAYLVVESLSGGSVIWTSEDIPVSDTQPQIIEDVDTKDGSDEADEIRITLYAGDGTEQDQYTLTL